MVLVQLGAWVQLHGHTLVVSMPKVLRHGEHGRGTLTKLLTEGTRGPARGPKDTSRPGTRGSGDQGNRLF